MTSVVQPDLIPQPWSQSGSHTTIPDTASEFGRASWALGFPPETALPLNAGGIPPNWLDFQGVLYALSQHAIFEQAGGRYTWSNTQNYPVGACIIGSNSIVYQALRESGPGTAAGAKNPVTAANSAYWGVVATPDGNTIKLVDGKLAADTGAIAAAIADGTTIQANNGKISVGAAATAALLADGTTIVASDGKLTAVGGGGGGGGDAASLVDNKTTVANNGKITVNLTNATVANLTNISQYLVKPDGGLAMDSSTGKLELDLDYIIPLQDDLSVYVDGASGSDTMVPGRGSVSLPFATIQAAVKYVTQTFALGPHNVTINITPGTYSGGISLPQYISTTGRITLRKPSDAAGTVTVARNNATALTCSGGSWIVTNINFSVAYTADAALDSAINIGSVGVERNPSIVFNDCGLAISYSGAAPVGKTVDLHGIYVRSGRVSWQSLSTISWSCVQGNATSAEFLHVRGRAYAQIDAGTLVCTGTCTTFCAAEEMSYVVFPLSSFSGSSVTGKKYDVQTGAGVWSYAVDLPGSTAGDVDAATYSWYKLGV